MPLIGLKVKDDFRTKSVLDDPIDLTLQSTDDPYIKGNVTKKKSEKLLTTGFDGKLNY